MLSERIMYIRNKPVPLLEVGEVYAIPPQAVRQTDAEPAAVAWQTVAPGISQADIRAYENAGWRFVTEDDATAYQPEVRAKVFIQNGDVRLDTGKLDIKFKGDLDKTQAQAWLTERGIDVKSYQQLSFAPGLFALQLNLPKGDDTLSVADRLRNSGEVDFAEPSLQQIMTGRETTRQSSR